MLSSRFCTLGNQGSHTLERHRYAMPAWNTITDRKHDFSFRVPAETPLRQEVRVDRSEEEGIHRVHVYSPDRSELYFEVVSYPGHIDHQQALQAQKSYLREQFVEPVIGATAPGTFQSLPRSKFAFQAGEITREFLYVDSAVRTYRIIRNPASALNDQVLSTFRLGIEASL